MRDIVWIACSDPGVIDFGQESDEGYCLDGLARTLE